MANAPLTYLLSETLRPSGIVPETLDTGAGDENGDHSTVSVRHGDACPEQC